MVWPVRAAVPSRELREFVELGLSDVQETRHAFVCDKQPVHFDRVQDAKHVERRTAVGGKETQRVDEHLESSDGNARVRLVLREREQPRENAESTGDVGDWSERGKGGGVADEQGVEKESEFCGFGAKRSEEIEMSQHEKQ